MYASVFRRSMYDSKPMIDGITAKELLFGYLE